MTALFAGCADLEEDVDLVDPEIRREMPSAEFGNVEITHTVDGEISFVVEAPLVHQHDRTNMTKLFGGIEVDFYEDGHINSHLFADSGVVLQAGRALEAYGNVRVVTDSGMVIETERMNWNKREQLIRSDTLVRVMTEYDTLYGDAMIASDNLEYKRLTNPRGVSHRNKAEGKGKPDTTEIATDTTTVDSTEAAYWDSLRAVMGVTTGDGDTVLIAPKPKKKPQKSQPMMMPSGGSSDGSGKKQKMKSKPSKMQSKPKSSSKGKK
ncbi:LPS export ABC transporter periplasmic protein LptC [bacterium]|nr:LPS export ABC transporter periplasmic protein LptC [bacterium]